MCVPGNVEDLRRVAIKTLVTLIIIYFNTTVPPLTPKEDHYRATEYVVIDSSKYKLERPSLHLARG